MENWKTALKEKLRQPLVFPTGKSPGSLPDAALLGGGDSIWCEKEREV